MATVNGVQFTPDVELNGEILPKAQYDSTIIADSDKIEIVSFVGGG